MDSEDIDIEKVLKLSRRVGLSDADRPESGIVDHNVQSVGLGKHSSYALLDGLVSSHVKLDNVDTLRTKSVGMGFVAAINLAHGCKYAVSCPGKRFGGIAAKTTARAGNENCFRHSVFLSLRRGVASFAVST